MVSIIGEEDEDFVLWAVQQFKAAMVVIIYAFSSYIKKFREDCKNFESQEELAKMIDRMISKIQ